MTEELLLEKADGSFEHFSEDKLRESLKFAHATQKDIDTVVDHIKSELRPGLKTQDIYDHAYGFLKDKGGSFAARYSLRKSLAELGPSGFPFERYISHVYEHKGYKARVGVMLRGKCVAHEIDVLAHTDNHLIIIEAKFHNQSSIKSDLKTVLYVSARYEDLKATNYDGHLKPGMRHSSILMTNTKFSGNAIAFGNCAGVELIGWSYPKRGNLQELIESENLHPVTSLTSLSIHHKNQLTSQGIVLCKSLRDHHESLHEMGLSEGEITTVMDEVNNLCHL